MSTAPRSIRFTLGVFYASVVVSGALGIVFIWDPPASETLFRVFATVLVVFGASMLILGGYRTVHHVPRDGP